MARIRTIKPSFFLSEELAALPYEWRLLFAGLWTQADREGRLEDRPLRLKAEIFPYDELSIESGLCCLAEAGLIVRYAGHGRRVIAIPTWHRHQKPNVKEPSSELPAPGSASDLLGVHPCPQEGKGREGNRKGREEETCAEPLRDSTPPVLTFPVIGPAGRTWDLGRTLVEAWQQDFPTVDVLAECRKAHAWVRANPGRRKTARGMPKFLVNWLSRAVDSGVGRRWPTTAAHPQGIPWVCLHLEPCSHRAMCEHKNNMPQKYPKREAS